MLPIDKIQAIRANLNQNQCWSHTSMAFQNQILAFVDVNAGTGDYVVEVGCYHGGLTAQLSFVTALLGKSLYVVDIDPGMLDTASKNVARALGKVPPSTHFHKGDLKSLLTAKKPSGRPILIFIDGDHRYAGVVDDIRATVSAALPRPLALAFHDFSLRYTTQSGLDVRVDDAIRDELSRSLLQPIGDLAGFSNTLACQPSAQGHYHRSGAPEGVVLTLF